MLAKVLSGACSQALVSLNAFGGRVTMVGRRAICELAKRQVWKVL
jgi:hypothetical protein